MCRSASRRPAVLRAREGGEDDQRCELVDGADTGDLRHRLRTASRCTIAGRPEQVEQVGRQSRRSATPCARVTDFDSATSGRLCAGAAPSHDIKTESHHRNLIKNVTEAA